MRRLFWVGVGVTAAVLAARWLREQRAKYGPSNVADRVVEGAQDVGRLVVLSVDEGRRVMAEKEAEIRHSLSRPVT